MPGLVGSGRSWRAILGDGVTPAALESAGARNMAVDQVLFDAVKAGATPALRFYRWQPACLSLGRNQPARGRYDVDGRVPGRDVVRRPTGGLAVFHDDEVTYSLCCPAGALASPRATYHAVHRAIARGLASLGVPALVAARDASRSPAPGDPLGVCFAAPAEGEILAAAGKLVGSAQRTEARTILQHGSILIAGSQERAAARTLAAAAAGTIAGPSADASTFAGAHAATSTLSDLLGRTPADREIIDAIGAAFEAETGIRLAPACLSADEVDRLPEAERRYASDDWTWRA